MLDVATLSPYVCVGLLEKPVFEQYGRALPVLFKKLFLVGKTGVGKTSTVHKLAGRGEVCVCARVGAGMCQAYTKICLEMQILLKPALMKQILLDVSVSML